MTRLWKGQRVAYVNGGNAIMLAQVERVDPTVVMVRPRGANHNVALTRNTEGTIWQRGWDNTDVLLVACALRPK